MNFELPFFTNLLVLLVVSRLFGELFERFKQPAMIGEIIAGVVLGPSCMSLIYKTDEIKIISELGVFFLIIIAGLEMNIDDILKSLKGRNIITSITAFFVPLFSGFAVGYFFGFGVMVNVFVGLCVAITALPVSIRILMDLGRIKSVLGQKIIAIAIFGDVLALTILGVLLNIKDTDMSISEITQATLISLLKLLIFLIILSATYYYIKKINKKGDYIHASLNKLVSFLKGRESLFAIFFAFVLLFATVTETLGFHFIVGAFFASMLISESVIGKKNLKAIEHTTNSISMGFLAPVFFAGIGLGFNLHSVTNYILLGAIVLTSYGSKILGGYLGGIFAGLPKKMSFMIGLGLNSRGVMELVIANIAYEEGLINGEVFSIIVLMSMISTFTMPTILKQGFKHMDKTTT